MTFEAYRRRVDAALSAGGGLLDFEDLVVAIEKGEMQSFTDGDNWVVTAIRDYPRKKVLEVVMAVGDYNGIVALQPEVVAFAKLHSCEGMLAVGRLGWDGMKTFGWKRTGAVYSRDFK